MSMESEIAKERLKIEKERDRERQQKEAWAIDNREKFIAYAYEHARGGCIALAARGQYETEGIFFKRKFVEYHYRIGMSPTKDQFITERNAVYFFDKYPDAVKEVVKRLEREGITVTHTGKNSHHHWYHFHVKYYIK